MPESLTPETRQVPRTAFEFAVPTQLAFGDRQDDRTPIELLARSPEPIDHWYWGKFVHELAGMTHAATIPLDYCHMQDEPVGAASQFDVADDGLHVRGELIHFREGDRADEIATKGKAGVPYQASIFFSSDPADLRLEYIPDGMFATANGREYEGPVTIARQSVLRGVAVCLYGYDRHTSTKLSTNPDDTVELIVHRKDDDPMPKTKSQLNATDETTDAAKGPATPTDPPTQEPEAPADDAASSDAAGQGDETKPAEDPADDSSDATQTDAPAELKTTELKAYVDAFGAENGVKWALAGKPLTECHALHAAELKAQLTAAVDKTKELETRIASLSTGEDDPAKFSADPKDATTQGKPAPSSQLAANRGEGFARLCAANPMPKSKS